MKQRVLSALMSIVAMGFVSQAWSAHFVSPKWNGYALDWCANFENGCGKPAADLFCQKKGYPQSSGFAIRSTVNFPTMTVGQNAICNPSVHRCDSFNYVDCQETVKVFYAPKYNGFRVDWCRQFEQQCGAPAALTYCQKNGFSQLVNFQKQGPLSTPTMTLGSNAICNPAYHTCDGFFFIQCKK